MWYINSDKHLNGYDLPGANECWYDGYDENNNPINQDRYEECGEDKCNQYYRAFIHGCKSTGNSEETWLLM
jgi:hypothetical protein